jgi:hypothetical protein
MTNEDIIKNKIVRLQSRQNRLYAITAELLSIQTVVLNKRECFEKIRLYGLVKKNELENMMIQFNSVHDLYTRDPTDMITKQARDNLFTKITEISKDISLHTSQMQDIATACLVEAKKAQEMQREASSLTDMIITDLNEINAIAQKMTNNT